MVVGAARSGVAAAELLARRGARVTLTEQRTAIPEAARLSAAGVALEAGGHQAATFDAAERVVVSPGVPLNQPVLAAAVRRGVEVIGEGRHERAVVNYDKFNERVAEKAKRVRTTAEVV